MACGAERWKALDLRRRGLLGPCDEELICLRMLPKSKGGRVRYEVGRFAVERGKSWLFLTNGGALDPVKVRMRYELRWCYLPEEDARERR